MRVLRQKGTEAPYRGEYTKFYPTGGHFVCKGCASPLYSAAAKFESGCGWPAFDKCYHGAVRVKVDRSHGMQRVEILCGRCGGHLGHVFPHEGRAESGERHCVNSVSLQYLPERPPRGAREAPVLEGGEG